MKKLFSLLALLFTAMSALQCNEKPKISGKVYFTVGALVLSISGYVYYKYLKKQANAQTINTPQNQPQQQIPLKQHGPNSCSSDCKLPNGIRYGTSHNDVYRAGVLLIVPTGKKSTNPFENYGIIVGHAKKTNFWMVGQAGGVDKKDTSTSQTASRELEEETGGYVKMNTSQIGKLPYIYAGKKQLFICQTSDNNLASNIQQSVKSAQHNKNLPHCYKEIDDISIVPISEFLKLIQQMDNGQVHKGNYFVKTITNQTIRLDDFYTQMFGSAHDHNRLFYAQQMFTLLCP